MASRSLQSLDEGGRRFEASESTASRQQCQLTESMNSSNKQPQTEYELDSAKQRSKHFPFMKLPAELRNQIYEYVVVNEGAYINGHEPTKLTSLSPLYTISNKVHEEFRGVLYKEATTITAVVFQSDFKPLITFLRHVFYSKIVRTDFGSFANPELQRRIHVKLQVFGKEFGHEIRARNIEDGLGEWKRFLDFHLRSRPPKTSIDRLTFTYRGDERRVDDFETMVKCFVDADIPWWMEDLRTWTKRTERELWKIVHAVADADSAVTDFDDVWEEEFESIYDQANRWKREAHEHD